MSSKPPKSSVSPESLLSGVSLRSMKDLKPEDLTNEDLVAMADNLVADNIPKGWLTDQV